MKNSDPCKEILNRLGNNPWHLGPQDRQTLLNTMSRSQKHWLPRLTQMVEPPHPQDGFPAFLLDTKPFESLRQAIGEAHHRSQLDTATADELQRFVDLYRCYLAEPSVA